MRFVRQGSEDSIKYKLMIDYTEPTIVGTPSAKLYTQNGAEITGASPAVSVSGSEVSTEDSWTEALFTVGIGYRLELSIVVGSKTHIRDVFFSVAPRGFESEISDSDVFAIVPMISSEAGSAGLAAWRRAAWEELVSEVVPQLGDSELWRVLDPSIFKRAHIYGTLWLFYLQNAKDSAPDSEDWEKQSRYEDLYREALVRAFSQMTVDKDGDDLLDDDESEQVYSMKFIQ